MASTEQLEVYRALRESQGKYTYFLLAAVGAAVGFALSQTKETALCLSQIPLGIAVVLWGLSFYLGCRNISYVNSLLYANSEMLRIESGQHPEVGTHPQMVGAASEGIREAMDHNAKKANTMGNWQFSTLIAGAIFYIFWHIVEMHLRS
jgi:hypothetical protein